MIAMQQRLPYKLISKAQLVRHIGNVSFTICLRN